MLAPRARQGGIILNNRSNPDRTCPHDLIPCTFKVNAPAERGGPEEEEKAIQRRSSTCSG